MKNGLTNLGVKIGVISRPSPSRPAVEEEEDPLDALYKKTVVRHHVSNCSFEFIHFLGICLITFQADFYYKAV